MVRRAIFLVSGPSRRLRALGGCERRRRQQRAPGGRAGPHAGAGRRGARARRLARDACRTSSPRSNSGPTGAPPLFSLRCDARRSVFLQRHGAAPSGDLPVMLVSVGSETRRLAVTSVGGAVPMLRASLAPSDTLVEHARHGRPRRSRPDRRCAAAGPAAEPEHRHLPRPLRERRIAAPATRSAGNEAPANQRRPKPMRAEPGTACARRS